MNVGRLSFSQEEQMQAATQPSASLSSGNNLSAASLSALKLSPPVQKAVDALVQAFEAKNGAGQPTAAQFQSLIAQVGALLTPPQQQQLQAMIDAGSPGKAAVVAGSNPLLSEFDLINAGAGAPPSGNLQLFNYLDGGSGTPPSSSDPSIAGSLWNFGAAGAPIRNALI